MTTPQIGPELLSALSTEYEILEEIGRGGTSSVYRARDRLLDREVAIKVIRDRYLEDPEARARVDREARMLAHLEHPNIVTVLGARRIADGAIALVMPLAQGRTLRRVLQDVGPFPAEAVREVLRQLASALLYLHRCEILHRDVKPENIFVEEDGRILLSDLGIAKSLETHTEVTMAGVVVGTPAYMSPEQIDGLPMDGRSDLYSLGLVGYEMLTGRRPWEGENLYTIIFKQKNEPLPPIARIRPDAPPGLGAALERAVQKKREDRWAGVEHFLRALEVPETAPATVAGEARREAPVVVHADAHAPDYRTPSRARVPVVVLATCFLVGVGLTLAVGSVVERGTPVAAPVYATESPQQADPVEPALTDGRGTEARAVRRAGTERRSSPTPAAGAGSARPERGTAGGGRAAPPEPLVVSAGARVDAPAPRVAAGEALAPSVPALPVATMVRIPRPPQPRER